MWPERLMPHGCQGHILGRAGIGPGVCAAVQFERWMAGQADFAQSGKIKRPRSRAFECAVLFFLSIKA